MFIFRLGINGNSPSWIRASEIRPTTQKFVYDSKSLLLLRKRHIFELVAIVVLLEVAIA